MDELLWRLGGPAAVAELTGRRSRVVRDAHGRRVESRNAPIYAPASPAPLAVIAAATAVSATSVAAASTDALGATASMVGGEIKASEGAEAMDVGGAEGAIELKGENYASALGALVAGKGGAKVDAKSEAPTLDMVNVFEKDAFMDGRKLVAIISGALTISYLRLPEKPPSK